MNRYEFDLDLSPDQYLHYDRGTMRQLMVRCHTGETVQFPASLLQPYLLPDGIHGRCVLTCDADRRHASLQPLSPEAGFANDREESLMRL